MEYRTLGRSGIKVSPLCLGTFNFGNFTPEDECARLINRALESGINVIDTANAYAGGESERIIGRTLAANGCRDQVIVATKVHAPVGAGPNDRGNSRLHIIKACEDSLRRLQTDYIDLYQIHRPDPDVPIDETLGALTDLIRQGKVRYIGCSTHPAWRVMEALMVSELKGYERYISEQPPYNLLDRRIENELVPMCQAHHLALLPWAPLAQGLLAGRYTDPHHLPADSRAALRGGVYAKYVTARGIETSQQFGILARDWGIPPVQLAILWVKDQSGITAPIVGPRTLEQLEHMLPVLDIQLDPALQAECNMLVHPGTAVVDFHSAASWMKMRVA